MLNSDIPLYDMMDLAEIEGQSQNNLKAQIVLAIRWYQNY